MEIQIQIETKLTRIERLARILKQIEEAEQHGYGSLVVTFHKHQITDSSLSKDNRYGNVTEEWYTATC